MLTNISKEQLLEAERIIQQHKKEQKEKNKCKTSTTTKVAVGVSVAVGAIALYGLYKMFTSNFTDEDVGYLVSGDDIR